MKASPAAKRTRRRSQGDIMDRIIAAAGDEFERAGYAGATTASIARRAEVTETQLFRYFASKAELFKAAIFQPLNQHFSAFHASMIADAAGSQSFRERAQSYIVQLQDFIACHSRMMMSLVVARAYEHGMPEGRTPIPALDTYFERGAAMMRSRIGGEAARVPSELMVRVSFAAVLGCALFEEWIFPPGLATDAAVRQAVVEFVIDGISANPNA
ncbi:MAG TPA: TetR/AcrR family transcriptional regulator [Acetobacteraceae bacterium]|nr:TetR/AcrR family transcriptional regulator [Acetobacteraceae bacterium]